MCRILYSLFSYFYVSFSGLGKRGLLITDDYVVSVRRGFLFLLVDRIGCIILLWHPWAFHIITFSAMFFFHPQNIFFSKRNTY